MFAARRQRVLEAMGPDAIAIIQGAGLVTRSNDTEFPFRQNSDFWYLTGFGHPNATAILRTNGGPAYTLFVEPRERETEIWTGYRPGTDGATQDYGADEAHPRGELVEKIPAMIQKTRCIYHQLGRDLVLDAKIIETNDNLRLRSRAGIDPPETMVDPRSIVHPMRLIKEPAELDIMRRAAAITREAHETAAQLAQPATYEYELQASLEYTFRRRGAHGTAYTCIVGGGRNATVLHYVENSHKLRESEMVLVDAGCELEGYASDVTRTYPIAGRFTGPGRAIYEIVLQAQLASLEQCQPGKTLADVHDASVRTIVEGLLGLGLLEGDTQDLIAREAYRPFYMHMTSHWLGLDVHDVGAYRIGGEHRPLEPGMVLTVEPGIYVDPDAELGDPSFAGIGVRIEDDVVICEGGHENLTGDIPKDPDDLEALVRA